MKGLFTAMAAVYLVGTVTFAIAQDTNKTIKRQREKPSASGSEVISSGGVDTGRVLHALIIGINRFQDSKIRNLQFCRADAEALNELLTDRRYTPFSNAQVKTLINEQATRKSVHSALQALGRKAAPNDTVVIYFSSHGIQQDNGKAYWVLHGSKVDRKAYVEERLRVLPNTALEQSEISALLNRIRARRLVVLVDSCFSAATVISYPRGKDYKSPQVSHPFAGFKGEGRVVLTASEGTQKAAEVSGLGHGAFTYFLLKGLRGGADQNRDNVVELWEIWKYLEQKVTEAARRQGNDQRPTISTLHLTHGFPLTTYPMGTAVQTVSSAGPPESSSQPTDLTPASPVPLEWVVVSGKGVEQFKISSLEITNRQFLEFVKANPEWGKGHIKSEYHDGDYLRHWFGPNPYPKGLDDHPVTNVSWFAAKAFAEWVGGRLPGEREWVLAASGPEGISAKRLYPWGGPWDGDLCNYRGYSQQSGGLSGVRTMAVNAISKGASKWPSGRIYNLSGNAWEWCDDWAFEYRISSGQKSFVVRPVDPGKKAVLSRLIKGGSFLADRIGCMIPSRTWADPRLCAEDGGFRVIKDR